MKRRLVNWGLVIGAVWVLVVLVFAAAVLRGGEAWRGITWGYGRVWWCTIWPDACRVDKKQIKVNFGVYDPQDKFSGSEVVAVEHEYVLWNKYRPGEARRFMEKARQRRRWPMITVEPWASGEEDLLGVTVQGKYDEIIDEICRDVGGADMPVFLRWGQEMERVTGRYPWAVEEVGKYIAAYRRFVERCRKWVSEGYYVWSPAGDKGLEGYWPGADVVDYVGLSVYELPEWDRENFGKPRLFGEILGERYGRVEKYGKPVMVAEMGVAGPARFQRGWMEVAFEEMGNFPLLKTAVYFNAVDSEGAWEEKYGVPDWHIDPGVFD